ncbi:uncharacterized protein [Zea mays]|uniref:uncharacterized protein n=1 Tax=Zea mays TaxID=4577 RepID=UPI0004DE900B|nr:uncharacterized protein LOC103636278 [Zea mays]|eukprot:XP_008656861.1 uncharacterized protein LOC103636278 [Zea mays]
MNIHDEHARNARTCRPLAYGSNGVAVSPVLGGGCLLMLVLSARKLPPPLLLTFWSLMIVAKRKRIDSIRASHK